MRDIEQVAVAGASGFVGEKLCEVLSSGYDVVALTRRPDRYGGAGRPVYADMLDPETLAKALRGVSVVYYLVHSLAVDDFAAVDATAARNLGAAARQAGVRQIVYLGGLGRDDDELSRHLASRRQVEGLLGAAGVPVTVLRASVIIGRGGLSWELINTFAALPVLGAPAWIETRAQPIALKDTLAYLAGVLGREETFGRTFDIGGPDVLTYAEMLRRTARLVHDRFLAIVAVPLVPNELSAAGISLMCGVDRLVVQHLLDSMVNETVAHDEAITDLVPLARTTFVDAVRAAT
ncbi:NAD(P)H-binding protein [Kribbella italica]|uniref:Uncharacterized protein YbjT (DUF2867 family) n=1 Tax=Kribbella italica TaxID=1540520 RepID=A0A7W9J587_9ACTN|nr:uncharacterized protein YbjT (DUF2867 family) [Kribbella italica]